jgi:hypothetical protein
MKELIENADEFMASGKDNIKKERWNAAVSDFFKAISNFCDLLIYKKVKILPKNHNERFDLLKKYFLTIYTKILNLFEVYRESYNKRLKMEDALTLQKTAYELESIVKNKN